MLNNRQEVKKMADRAYKRYTQLEKELETDGEYLYLMDRLQRAEPGYRDAMNALGPEHRQNILEYLGTLGEIYDRITEICTFLP